MRLVSEECELVMPLIRDRLSELCEARLGLDEATILFRVLWRYHNPYPGRPLYPESVTWADIEALLKNGPLIDEEVNGPFSEEGETLDAPDNVEEEVFPGGVGGEEVKNYGN